MSKLPNFLIIGAAKSGTTALYHYLNQHPDIFLSEIKETNFFALEGKNVNFKGPGDKNGVHKRSITDIDNYKLQYKEVQKERAIGEVCPLYLYSQDASVNIKKHIPNVKIIAILREPVARAYSAWVHLKRDGREYLEFEEALEDEPRRIKENWAEIWHYFEEGNYYTQLSRYYDNFPKKNIKVFIYEDFKKSPKKVYAEICKFIGVSEGFLPDMSAKHNKGGVPQLQWLFDLMNKRNILKSIFNFFMNKKVRKFIKKKIELKNVKKKPKLNEETRIRMQSMYSSEISKLEELLEVKLSIWKD